MHEFLVSISVPFIRHGLISLKMCGDGLGDPRLRSCVGPERHTCQGLSQRWTWKDQTFGDAFGNDLSCSVPHASLLAPRAQAQRHYADSSSCAGPGARVAMTGILVRCHFLPASCVAELGPGSDLGRS